MTFTTAAENKPWSCQVFYAYHEASRSLVFTSSADTRHIKEATSNPAVAVSIVLESKVVARLQGVQIEAAFHEAEEQEYRTAFIKRFPMIALSPRTMWRLEITTAKYTDNTLGFGTKLHFPSIELPDEKQ